MQKNRLFLFGLVVAMVGGSAGLTGCATPATKEAMTARGIPGVQQHRKSVAVSTQGGNETGAMESSNISNGEFAKAIEESITQNKLFTQVIQGQGGADYLLNVAIVNMSKPSFGASFTVSMEGAWTLTQVSTKKVVMRESIRSSATATIGQAFVGAERLRLAVEGAARENIRLGLTAISKLHLE